MDNTSNVCKSTKNFFFESKLFTAGLEFVNATTQEFKNVPHEKHLVQPKVNC